MKKMYKSKIKLCFIMTILMITFFLFDKTHAQTLASNHLPIWTLAWTYSCVNQGKLYLDNDNDQDGKADKWLYLRDNIQFLPPAGTNAYQAWWIQWFSNAQDQNNTKVEYFSTESEMVKKRNFQNNTFSSLDNDTFFRASRVLPYSQRVRWIDTVSDIKILFEKPINAWSSRTVSLKYIYKYRYAMGFLAWNPGNNFWYATVTSPLDFSAISNYVMWWSTQDRDRSTQYYEKISCKNYLLSRCGDGTPDVYITGQWITNFTPEVCDEGALNGTAGHCNATCSAIPSWPSCGNGIVEGLEECDAGANNGSDLCEVGCVFPVVDVAVDEAVNE